MSDSLLERYASRELPGFNGHTREDEDDVHDLGTFGFLRGSRERATMLELRKRDGNILAVGYGWLERLEFNPSEGIFLHLAGRKVRIMGRQLNVEVHPKVRLFEAICRHRVPWVREAGREESLLIQEGRVVIETIQW